MKNKLFFLLATLGVNACDYTSTAAPNFAAPELKEKIDDKKYPHLRLKEKMEVKKCRNFLKESITDFSTD